MLRVDVCVVEELELASAVAEATFDCVTCAACGADGAVAGPVGIEGGGVSQFHVHVQIHVHEQATSEVNVAVQPSLRVQLHVQIQ